MLLCTACTWRLLSHWCWEEVCVRWELHSGTPNFLALLISFNQEGKVMISGTNFAETWLIWCVEVEPPCSASLGFSFFLLNHKPKLTPASMFGSLFKMLDWWTAPGPFLARSYLPKFCSRYLWLWTLDRLSPNTPRAPAQSQRSYRWGSRVHQEFAQAATCWWFWTGPGATVRATFLPCQLLVGLARSWHQLRIVALLINYVLGTWRTGVPSKALACSIYM